MTPRPDCAEPHPARPHRAEPHPAALFAVDPVGIGGVLLRARAGPARDVWLATLARLLPAPPRRLPLHADDQRLLGGLDLTATLSGGRRVVQQGLLADSDGGVLLLPMAERAPVALAARLSSVLDSGVVRVERDGVALLAPARLGMVALDEGIGDDERVPAALADRLGLHVVAEAHEDGFGAADVAVARQLLPRVAAGDDAVDALCACAVALGIGSLRAPLQALRVARAAAALAGRVVLEEADIALAARLVLAPRARCAPAADADAEPAPADDAPPPPPPPDGDAASDAATSPAEGELPERVLEAALSALPPDVLLRLQAAAGQPRTAGAGSGRSGAVQRSRLRGRPLGSERGDPRRARLDVLATLRAAAPWQALRRRDPATAAAADVRALTSAAPTSVSVAQAPASATRARTGAALTPTSAASTPTGAVHPHLRRDAASVAPATPMPASAASAPSNATCLHLRRDDFRVRRHADRRETTTIFAVDGSGSAALHRLAEAKGAVELLLADCYVRRDRVALIGFRRQAAELLLAPTRSLPRAKRCLAELAGGGGTPLAAGIAAAQLLAAQVLRGGGSATVVLLTDGRANVARDGSPGRAAAHADALAAARVLATIGVAALWIDTSPQAQAAGREVADAMRARYLALPHADAAQVAAAVGTTPRRAPPARAG